MINFSSLQLFNFDRALASEVGTTARPSQPTQANGATDAGESNENASDTSSAGDEKKETFAEWIFNHPVFGNGIMIVIVMNVHNAQLAKAAAKQLES